MPVFERFSADKVATWRPARGRAIDLTEYTDFLRQLEDGEGGEVTISEAETRKTVKRHLRAAAKRLGKQVRYRRAVGDLIRFELT